VRTALWIAAGLICLALVGGACGGDDEEEEPRGSAYTQPQPPPTTTQDDPDPPSDGAGGGAAPGEAEGELEPESEPESEPRQEAEAAAPPERDGDAGEGARAAVRTFLDAMADEDARRACSKLTREVRTLVGGTLGGSCARGMEFAFLVIGGNDGAFRRVRVRDVEVDGDRALARLLLPRELRTLPLLGLLAPGNRVALERDGGGWRLALARP
jgi:hypothetical protein